MPIRCEIVSQDRMVFQGEVDMVVLPGIEGEMGILPNHSPILSTLGIGILKLRRGEKEEIFTITGGVAEVQPDIITILADAAENVQEIDIARAEAARQRAEELLKAGSPPDTDEYLALAAALRRSNLRLRAVQKYQGNQTKRIKNEREGET